MRKIELSLLVILVLFFLFSETNLIFGLQQNQASVTLFWSKQTYYQGEDGTITISFETQSPEKLKITRYKFCLIGQPTKTAPFQISQRILLVFQATTTTSLSPFSLMFPKMQHKVPTVS